MPLRYAFAPTSDLGLFAVPSFNCLVWATTRHFCNTLKDPPNQRDSRRTMEIACPSVLGAFARDFRDEDLLECLLINSGRIGDELVGRARAIEIWKTLVRSRCFSSTVI